jgi:hypothetical protein
MCFLRRVSSDERGLGDRNTPRRSNANGHRADTVKTAPVRDGVPAATIDEIWHGKENPRASTADGVREPRNRRAEITM